MGEPVDETKSARTLDELPTRADDGPAGGPAGRGAHPGSDHGLATSRAGRDGELRCAMEDRKAVHLVSTGYVSRRYVRDQSVADVAAAEIPRGPGSRRLG